MYTTKRTDFRQAKLFCSLAMLCMCSQAPLRAQEAVLPMNSPGSYFINFDGLRGANLPNFNPEGAGHPWKDGANVNVKYWYAEVDGNPADQYYSNNGNSGLPAIYSYGGITDEAGAINRSLGLLSGNAKGDAEIPSIGLRIRNEGRAVISNLLLSFTAQQWRASGSPEAVLEFSYQVNPPGHLGEGAWTPVPELCFANLKSGEPRPLNGMLPENQEKFVDIPITGLSIAPGEEAFLRWRISGPSGHGFAIDDVTLKY